MAIRNYLIAVGGSGTKALESFIHMSAIGYSNSQEPINIAIIDMDMSNGNLDRTKTTIEYYLKVRKTYQKTNTNDLTTSFPCFGNDFAMQHHTLNQKTSETSKLVWAPVANTDQVFGNIIRSYRLNEQDDLLIKSLYTEDELKLNLREGFKGHPSIGSLLLSDSFNIDLDSQTVNDRYPDNEDGNRKKGEDLFWSRFCGKESEICNSINSGDEFRIMVVGSIFGGTGAACVPTIIKKLHSFYSGEGGIGDVLDRVKLGVTLLLPYFAVKNPQDGIMRAKNNDFIRNSRYALQYYKDIGILDHLTRCYFYGLDYLEEMEKVADGGFEQQNKPLLPELLAATGINEFFTQQSFQAKFSFARRAEVIPLSNESEFQFVELPDIDEKLKNYLRFSLMFNHYSNKMKEISNKTGKENIKMIQKENWSSNYFSDILNEYKTYNDKMLNLSNYNNAFYLWFNEMFENCKGNEINTQTVKKYSDDIIEDSFEFKRLGLSNDKKTKKNVMINLRDDKRIKDCDSLYHFYNDLYNYTKF